VLPQWSDIFMANWIAKKIFGSRNARIVKKLWPLVAEVNKLEQALHSLSDDELRAKTDELRARVQTQGESLDAVMLEAYAIVKNACRRLVGRDLPVCGEFWRWEMIPFDVQVLGAIVLHRGGITEMATGEGKTLVATMPLYLNALSGRNCQLVTVNDYLAKRDSEWMGAVFTMLGISVGCIQSNMPPDERRRQYACDITYGTNSEFGFDYLRDMGMAMRREDMVQRDHYFVIIDEIDSILVDEARTPLIISGPAAVSTHRYDSYKPMVAELFRRQSLLCARLVKEAREVLANDSATDEQQHEALVNLCKVRLGMPKHKQLMRLLEDPSIRKRVEKTDLEIHSDTNRGWLYEVKETLYFSIDERGGGADLSSMGRKHLAPDDEDAFMIPDLVSELSQIDSDPALSEAARLQARQQAQERFDYKSETLHNISQLLRAYCLFEKDVQYVVQDNKVMIVDEFTGRMMVGRRYSEGLHQALEAKEGVQIERETQTLATITIQNYFRMYGKLAGMTGTAETEQTEFKQIYDLNVVVVPTNKPCIRIDQNDRIYKTKREKYNAIIEEVAQCHTHGQPVLLGTASVDVSEVLSRMLQRRRIVHTVLNAKLHEREAEVIARAGQTGSVTIATNMAGRGTDIKLGEGVRELGGLHVIGSERHDSRRIDRQLRGRCSRQGDPGSSRFYVSLEDNLMRLFGSDRVSSIMEKLGLEEGEELSHPLLNRSIERAQRRVEQQHFSVRKRRLEYDDVRNKQRQVVYGLRRDVLMTEEPRQMLFDFVYTAVCDHVEAAWLEGHIAADELLGWLGRTFPIGFSDADLIVNASDTAESISERLVARIDKAYSLKEKNEDPEHLRWLERQIMLNSIDKLFQEHLYAMDALEQAIYLRAFGQRDPLIEFKQEAYGAFAELMTNIKNEILFNMFRSATSLEAFRRLLGSLPQKTEHLILGQFGDVIADAGTSSAGKAPAKAGSSRATAMPPMPSDGDAEMAPIPMPVPIPMRRELPKVGRNDPCPCGSGKKFKKCCGS